MSTNGDLIEVRKLDAAATKGPWIANGQSLDQYAPHPDGNRLLHGGSGGDDDYSNLTAEDIAFIARSRTLLPQLAAVLEAWQAATKLCAEHLPDGDHAPGCVKCALEAADRPLFVSGDFTLHSGVKSTPTGRLSPRWPLNICCRSGKLKGSREAA